jgi:hypothetical protein
LPGIGIHDLVAVAQALPGESLRILEMIKSARDTTWRITAFAVPVLKKNEPFHGAQLLQS